MSDLSVAITLQDKVSSALNRISDNTNATVSTFKRLDEASDKALNEKSIKNCANAVDGLKSAWGQVAGAIAGVASIYSAINFSKSALSAYDVQIEAETKLETVMRQRMNANNEMIQSVKDLASAQQQIGVVGDEVQLAGAQQLATFTNNSDALKTLIPAMNNLAVQQNGVNVSSGNMVNIGNLMGKVLQGQTSALSRVGISFTEAQEKILKTGSEMERASVLAQVITDNVGNMNEAMAQTDAGKIQQMKNDWGDMYEVLGGQLYPVVGQLFATIRTYIPQITTLLSGVVTVISYVVSAIMGVIDVATSCYNYIANNWSTFQPLIVGIVTAIGLLVTTLTVVKVATVAWSVVTAVLNSTLWACPLVWIVGAIAGVVTAIVWVCNKIAEWMGVTQSGLGLIFGCFTWLGANVWNVMATTFNSLTSLLYSAFVNPIAGVVEWIVNAFNGGFNSIGDAFLNLLGKLTSWLLGFAKSASKILDAVFNTDIAGTLGSLQTKLESMGKNENAVTFKLQAPKLKTVDTSKAFNAGATVGDNLNKRMDSVFKTDTPNTNNATVNAVNANTSAVNRASNSANAINGETAKNTKATKKSIDISNQNLEYMRDIAEKEAINKFTTAEIKVDMKNNNTINNGLDLNTVIKQLSNGVREAMQVSASGVY